MTAALHEEDLHRYVDGEADAVRRALVEAAMRRHPEIAARVSDYRRQNELMRELFAPAGEAPLTPAQLDLARRLALHLEGSRLRRLVRPLAFGIGGVALAGALALTVTLYAAHTQPEPPRPSFAETAATVHNFYAASTSEPTEFGAEATARLNAQLARRLGAPVRLPDLGPEGLTLTSGRLLPVAEGVAVQLLYRDKAGRLVTLFLGTAHEPASSAGLRHVERSNLSLYTWLDGRIDAAVVGAVNDDELRRIAEAARHSLLPRSDEPPRKAPDGSSRT